MAIQLAADAAPNGRVHCMNPPARNDPPPPAPIVTLARPLSPCADASHTVRKQRTWLAYPAATAAQAVITEPSWPGRARPPLNQLRFRRRAPWSPTMPTPENPGGVSMFPG